MSDDRVVVLVDHATELGGAQIAMVQQLSWLRDVRVHAVLSGPGAFSDTLEDRLAATVEHTLPDLAELRRTGRPSPAQVRTLAATWPAIRRTLAETGAGALVANTPKAAVLAVPAARSAGVPSAWFVRERMASDYYESAVVRALLRSAVRALPSRVFYNSAATAAACGAPGTVLYSPLPDAFLRPLTAAESPRLQLATVGRIDDWKGQDLVVDALARIASDVDFDYHVLGSAQFGHGEALARLERLVDERGLASRVHLHGFVDDVDRRLDSVDVLVHYPKSPEPLGQAIQQGMARGCTVVASWGGGASELLRTGVDGILVRPGDPPSLARTLAAVAADPELRRRLGAAAHVRARAFGADQLAPRFVGAVDDLLASGR